MGKFVEPEDVTDRYEGEFPTERSTWLDLRIGDVEADLILMVPSLGVPVGEIDPTRLQRVKSLVADKVLDLYRNPERSRSRTSTSGPYSDSVTTADTGRVSPKGYFTDDEVRNVRLRAKRSNLGMTQVKPFKPHVPAPGDYWGIRR